MVVQHNITAINANRYYGINNNKLAKSLEKLSSGYAINRAGDNAAGLAVSEKMRSQIAGINQGVKNAQDGISMIQTFEGALTETDSILQRMKVLADQSANGTYQNEVDRDAIQLEFNQLNDELNQIADTDFNGVVVLNGGKLSDGTVAVNGKFDYANQPERDAKMLGQKDVEALNYTAYSQSKGTYNTDAGENDMSGDLFESLGLTKNDDSVDLTFKLTRDADGVDTWVLSGSDKKIAYTNGKTNLSIVQTNGGFAVLNTKDGAAATINDQVAAVVMDTSKLVDGDEITLTFTRPTSKNQGAEMATYNTDDLTVKKDSTLTVTTNVSTSANAFEGKDNYWVEHSGDDDTKYNVNADGEIKEMTEEAYNAFKGLNGAEITFGFTASKFNKTDGTAQTADTVRAADSITFKLGDKEVKLDANTTTNTINVDGNEYTLEMVQDASGAAYTDVANGAMDKDVRLQIKDASGTVIAQVCSAKMTSTKDEVVNQDSSLKVTLAVQTPEYTEANKPTVSVKDNGESSVSKSNAYDQATAPLTYTNHVMLQAGARTKDLVDFTFEYKSDGLGDLKADLDCSARGLGTDKLSLATQEDANYAIDRIDNAINKTNMVRATFGAVQNRLEHKIDNLNVTSENLTSAESRIRDTNMAEEMMAFTKNQILAQASQSMLAQANQLPQGVLSLLQ